MRMLLSFHVTSLDGYYEGPARRSTGQSWMRSLTSSPWVSWMRPTRCCSGGSPTKLMAGYWPTPAAEQDNPAVSAKMNGLDKIVVSRTLGTADWAPTQVIGSDVAEALAKLKQQPGKNMMIMGSSALTVSLIGMGLVDEVPGRGEPGRARRRRVPVPDRRGTDRPDAPAGQVFPLRQCLAPLPARCPVRRRPR